MNAERLLALYERVAEAPDAVPRLRRFVLDLAVRGKLVAQKAGDEPASELLNKTNARLSQAKRGRKKEQGIAERQDLIFEIPAHWKPLFVAQALQELQTGPFGSSLHKKDYRRGGTPVLNPASIQNGRIVPISDMAVGQSTLERLASFKVRTNDILMARRGEMGRCAVVTQREEGWLCGTGSLILRPSDVVFSEYLTLVISSPTGRAFLGGAAVGTTMQNLNQSILLRMPFGLPPLAEQRRIVAKVDELMALCDRLGPPSRRPMPPGPVCSRHSSTRP
jgi:type I restriction enzyme S subunit